MTRGIGERNLPCEPDENRVSVTGHFISATAKIWWDRSGSGGAGLSWRFEPLIWHARSEEIGVESRS